MGSHTIAYGGMLACVVAALALLLTLPARRGRPRRRGPGRHSAAPAPRRWPSADEIRERAIQAAGRRLAGNVCIERLPDPERLVWVCPRRYPDGLDRGQLVQAVRDHDEHVLSVDPNLQVPHGPRHPEQLRGMWRRELFEAAARHTTRCIAEPAPPAEPLDAAAVAEIEDQLRGDNRCQ